MARNRLVTRVDWTTHPAWVRPDNLIAVKIENECKMNVRKDEIDFNRHGVIVIYNTTSSTYQDRRQMNIKHIRTLAALTSILMTVAMLAGVRAGFQVAPIHAPHALVR